jgi:hypothetical protein
MTPQLRITATLGLVLVVDIGATGRAQVVERRDALGRKVTQHCQPAEWPKKLPALDSVVDSAAFMGVVEALSYGDTTPIVLSILYKTDGTGTVRLLEPDSLPLEVRGSLLEGVAAGLHPLKPSQRFGAVRVQLRGGSHGTATVARSLYCPPEPAPGGPVGPQTITITGLTHGDRLPAPGHRVHIDAELTIDENGHVTDVRMNTGSGIQDLDDAIIRDERQRLYLPAMIDGVPLASWVRTTGSRMRL